MQIGALISELNELLADVTTDVQSHDALMTRLSPANLAVFEFLPASTRQQLLLDRDPHGNVQVGQLYLNLRKLIPALRLGGSHPEVPPFDLANVMESNGHDNHFASPAMAMGDG